MKVLDLFSGIGGFSLGLERAGMETVAFCEVDPFCRKVLTKHWPDIPIHNDIRRLNAKQYRGTVDVVCGGFPCQDISTAGKGAGITGERSGLWSELCRIISEVRPRYAIMENVSALLSRGLGDILRDLASIGYDAEWHCIPASYVGAPHIRDRIWIVAYPSGSRRWKDTRGTSGDEGPHAGWGAQIDNFLNCNGESDQSGHMANTQSQRRGEARELQCEQSEKRFTCSGEDVADTNGINVQGFQRSDIDKKKRTRQKQRQTRPQTSIAGGVWATEPSVGRVANGIPGRTHRLRALGNAVVPQVVEVIGRAILEIA